MIRDAQAKLFSAVVVYDISRGSRDVADWFNFRKIMKSLGVEIISATERLGDISNPNDFLIELINVGLGQHMVLQTRQKSIAGVAMKAKQGAFLGGIAPLGYNIQDQKYVINEHEAEAVKYIFAEYAAGKSYNAIVSELTRQGIRGKKGRPLGKNSLHAILKNERYIGTYTWNQRKCKNLGKWIGGAPNPDAITLPDTIPAIIDTLLWKEVQKRMADQKGRARNKAKRTYLLSGLIECDMCGAAYVGHCSTNKRGYESRQYRCGNKYRTKTCAAKSINADMLENHVIESLKAFHKELDIKEMAKIITDQMNTASRDLSRERNELKEIEAKIYNGVQYFLSGKQFPELQDELDRLRVRKSELEDIIIVNTREDRLVTSDHVEGVLLYAINAMREENISEVIRMNVSRIYAHADGTCTINIGVHTDHSGSPQYAVCTTQKYAP